MALVKVRLYATVREAAGTSEISLNVSTLAEVLYRLRMESGHALASMLSEFQDDPEKLVVLLNGRNVWGRKAHEVVLRDGDEVSIFPPVSGG